MATFYISHLRQPSVTFKNSEMHVSVGHFRFGFRSKDYQNMCNNSLQLVVVGVIAVITIGY